MRYWDLVIWSVDKHYLDRLADTHHIDYYDADIYINEDSGNVDITNQLFNYVLTEAVNNLDISDDNKEYLQSKIYCNCFDSWYDITSEDVDEVFKWTKKSECNIIKEFLDL